MTILKIDTQKPSFYPTYQRIFQFNMKHIHTISEYCVYCSIGTQYFYVRSIHASLFETVASHL